MHRQVQEGRHYPCWTCRIAVCLQALMCYTVLSLAWLNRDAHQLTKAGLWMTMHLWGVVSAPDGGSALYSALAGQASYDRIHHTFGHKANLCVQSTSCTDCQDVSCARKLVHIATIRDISARSEHFTQVLEQRHHRHAGESDRPALPL